MLLTISTENLLTQLDLVLKILVKMHSAASVAYISVLIKAVEIGQKRVRWQQGA